MAEPGSEQPEAKEVDIRIDALTHELRQQALRDSLTGLLNRRGFDKELHRLWENIKGKPLPMGLVKLDLDDLQAINDSYGRATGDAVLKECARRVAISVREEDRVCRYDDSDEILVLLPGSLPEYAHTVAERLTGIVSGHPLYPGIPDLRVTLAVEVQHLSLEPGQNVEQFQAQVAQMIAQPQKSGPRTAGTAPHPFSPGALPESPAKTADQRQCVLVVDDDPAVGSFFRQMLTRENYRALAAESGAAAQEILRQERGRIEVALVDLVLGEEDGLIVLRQLREIDDTLIGVIVTGQATVENAVSSLRTGAFDFVQKPVARAQLLAVLERALKYRRLLVENREYQHHLEEMVREKNAALGRALEHVNDSYQFTLEAMADMLDRREQQTGEHSKRVARIALVLAREMGITSPEELDTIQTGALLHDIGKIAIPDAILLKTGPLTPEEREIMKRHSHIGYNIIKAGPGLEEASEIILAHQERFDGTGYPRGLKGNAISLGARIFAVVDAYDAIRSDRPYARGRSAREALDEIVKNSGTQFDPAVVAGLKRCWAEIETAGGWPQRK